jgi:hypothetical protein
MRRVLSHLPQHEHAEPALLDYACISACYDSRYKITKEQLEYLAERVKKLQGLTNKICKKKIGSFT